MIISSHFEFNRPEPARIKAYSLDGNIRTRKNWHNKKRNAEESFRYSPQGLCNSTGTKIVCCVE